MDDLYKRKKFIINFVYSLIWVLIIFTIFKLLSVYLLPFVIGLLIAYFMQKPALITSRKIKIKKEICAAVFSLAFYVFIIAVLGLVFWLIYIKRNKIFVFFSEEGNIKNYIDAFLEKIYLSSEVSNINVLFSSEIINEIFLKISKFISNSFANFLKNIPDFFISSAITVVATLYISKDYDKLKKFALGMLNNKFYDKFVVVRGIFVDCVFKIIIGYLLLYAITFVELVIGLYFVGISNFFLLSLLISIVDLLPVFGTGAVLVPWAIINFLKYNFKLGFGLFFLYVFIAVIRNFLEPKIIGKQTGLNPVFMLVFIFLGLRFGGVIGMIFIPVIFTVAFAYFRKESIKQ